MEMSGQLRALAALPPEKEPLVPIGWEAGWTPELDVVVNRKIPSLRQESNPRIPIIQPIAQRYTDLVPRITVLHSVESEFVPVLNILHNIVLQ
jgi:hypothetical protein